ncbi:Carbamoyl-phosphate synthase, partial [Elasticomyces elasticus]
MPVGVDSSVTEPRALKIAQRNSQHALCDYNFSVAATSTNADQIGHLTGEIGSLFIPFNHLSGNVSKVAAVTSHFAAWPANKPLITDAKSTDLASILLLASLHSRNIHVMSVTSKEDIGIIALSKEKGLKVTCDVSIACLFLNRDDFPDCQALPTPEDQAALWSHLSVIDVFSIGSIPYQLASDKGASPASGVAESLPLLFTAVSEGRLTVEDIVARLYENPKKIFELHDQVDSSVEVEVDRSYVYQSPSWSPFNGKVMKGAIQRVTFQGRTSCLDGELAKDSVKGTDMSSHRIVPASPAVKPLSPVVQPRPESSLDRRASLSATP